MRDHSTLQNDLDGHRAYQRIYQPGKLSFGFIMPLEGYPDAPFPTLAEHTRLARWADDTGQMLDPMIYMGYLAAHTSNIAFGTAGIVLPLRDPIILAKQAASIDQLTGGRLVLGLSSGDRATEYPAFGANFENRGERFQEAVGLIKTLTQERFPQAASQFYGQLRGNLDLIPKPFAARLPLVVVGRARQEPAWIARNTDGWINHITNFARLGELLDEWRGASEGLGFKPYGYGGFFELVDQPSAPLRYIGNRNFTTNNRKDAS